MFYHDDPKTMEALVKWMTLICFNFENYSINNNYIYEGNVLEKDGDNFIGYYRKKGETGILQSFTIEEEMVTVPLEEINSDKWTRFHCFGFITWISDHQQLAIALTDMRIEFTQE